MPLIVPSGLPAISVLAQENIVIDSDRSLLDKSHVRPVRVVILNLMPLKTDTENDLLRMLSYSSLTIDVSFMKLRSHTSTHTPVAHMDAFYRNADELMKEHFDGMIVTGAPVETIDYKKVDYWDELVGVLDWARTNVRSSLYLCWGAMAALYHFYGVPKHLLPAKCFGVFDTVLRDSDNLVFRGFDDVFCMPNSRHTEIRHSDIKYIDGLTVLAESEEAGVSIAYTRYDNGFYVLGHLEYPVWTLDKEYHRDLGKRDDVNMPLHYYPDDNPGNLPKMRWKSAATLFYNNWLKYYVCPPTVAK